MNNRIICIICSQPSIIIVKGEALDCCFDVCVCVCNLNYKWTVGISKSPCWKHHFSSLLAMIYRNDPYVIIRLIAGFIPPFHQSFCICFLIFWNIYCPQTHPWVTLAFHSDFCSNVTSLPMPSEIAQAHPLAPLCFSLLPYRSS